MPEQLRLRRTEFMEFMEFIGLRGNGEDSSQNPNLIALWIPRSRIAVRDRLRGE